MLREYWLVIDPESNNPPEWFKTESEAVAAGNAAIQEYLERDAGWADGVENVIVAKITHRSKKIPLPFPEDVQEAMDDDPTYKPPYDEYCNYEMAPVGDKVDPAPEAPECR